MKMKKFMIACYMALAFPLVNSCEKYLEQKPDSSLSEANSLKDIEALFSNTMVMNYYSMGIGEASSDNYYLDGEIWKALEQHERNIYVWGEEIFYDFYLNSWLDYYQTVYYSNYALNRLEKMGGLDQGTKSFNDLKGRALFYRGFAFYKLVTMFAKTYSAATSGSDLGIPLRLSDDFNQPSVRSTVKECYDQIINDMLMASELLPEHQNSSHSPSRSSAFTLLSWIYLIMQDFGNTERYALKSLEINDRIIHYGTLDPSDDYPFLPDNSEAVFTVATGSLAMLSQSYAKIDSTLYASYGSNDYRKKLFFGENGDGSVHFKGSYAGSNGIFMGLTTIDSYLNLAEALVRQGKVVPAKFYLGKLLENRIEDYDPSSAEPLSDSETLELILRERRKEFVMRDSRWIEIKRLNRYKDVPIIPTRVIDGKNISLVPGENRYALPLPSEIVRYSGMPQNPR